MNERIKTLRKALGLTQQEFANRIGISRNNIATYETRKSGLGNSVIALICREFNVSEAWLRTGNGEMFVPSPDTTIDQLIEEFHLDELDRKIITAYLELPEAERKAVKSLIQNMAQRTQKDDVATRTIEKEARDEAERYYQELVREKRQTSQALFANESDAG